MLEMRLARTYEVDFVGVTQTRAIPHRSIHEDLHLTRYILERVGKIPGKCEVLVHIDQPKSFENVGHP